MSNETSPDAFAANVPSPWEARVGQRSGGTKDRLANAHRTQRRYGSMTMIVAVAVAAGIALFTAMLFYFTDLPDTDAKKR